jgi:hypothetical protein
MTFESSTKTNWLKLGVEGLVIVVSILLAFVLQAWWDDRKDAQAERQMLVALDSELQGALTMLDDQLDLQNLQADSSKAVADNMVAAGEGVNVLVSNHEIATLFNHSTYDPPFGITSALLGSGQTSILGNSELRAALGRWPAAIADGVEDQMMVMKLGTDQIAPLVQQSVADMGPVHASNIVEAINRDSSLAVLEGSSEINSTRELWNLLYQRNARIRIAVGDLGRTRVQLLELIDLVKQELEKD